MARGGRYLWTYFHSIIDDGFAVMGILLAVVNEGLGACFVGAFHDREVREVLGLPPDVRPIGIIPIGYCSEELVKLPPFGPAQELPSRSVWK
jgi:nitroreductase